MFGPDEVMSVDTLGTKRPRPGWYLLRGVLSCRPCGALLLPTFSSNGRRYYGCPDRHCPRPWIPAEATEQLVWARVVSLHGSALGMAGEQRRFTLGAVLDRVTVGLRPADLEYHWRDRVRRSAAVTGHRRQDESMASTIEIPLVGGTADGSVVVVELDPNGRPPLTHHHLSDGGLAGAEIYELESDTGEGRTWSYQWRGPAT